MYGEPTMEEEMWKCVPLIVLAVIVGIVLGACLVCQDYYTNEKHLEKQENVQVVE